MLQKFKDYIESNYLIENDEKVLLAVSGGIDSITLIHLCDLANINFAIAHCNFQLRGKDSAGDQTFVSSLAKKYGVDFYTVNFDTNAYIKSKSVSTQMAARELRYDWFSSLMTEKGYQKLAIAHHLNDSLETVVFNLSKGTGIAGLRGIKPMKDQVIRPLLFASKESIFQFAKNNGLTCRDDVSNESDKYNRNFIRHQVIPKLEEINPAVIQNFHETMDRLRVTERVYMDYINKLREQYSKSENNVTTIDAGFLEKEEDYVLLFELIRDYGFSLRQAKGIVKKNAQTGANYYSKTHWLVKNRGELIITDLPTDENEMQLLENSSTIFTSKEEMRIWVIEPPKKLMADRNIAYLDFDKLRFPLVLRAWKEGERFSPLGMKGKKKISDFMIDHKIPLNLKKSYKVLTSMGEIVWLVGLRVDNRFKVTKDTNKVYQIEIVKKDV